MRQRTKSAIFILLLIVFFLGACKEMGHKRQPLTGHLVELFKNPQSLSEKYLKEPLSLKNALIKGYDLSEVNLSNATFDNTEWSELVGKKSHLSNIVFKNSDIKDVNFSASTLTNVTFENVTFLGARFHHSTFINVNFVNCRLLDRQMDYFRGFNEITASEVTIIDSAMENITFSGSQGVFFINKTSMVDSSFSDMKLGSSLEIKSSQLDYVDFDGSNLTSFTVTDSQLKKTKLQDSNIGKVVLINSTLDVYFSRAVIDTVRVSETQNELLGFLGSNVNDCSIGFCKKGGLIGLTGMKFKTLKINSCNDIDLKAPEVIGKDFTISNSRLKEAKFYDMAVEHFILDNVGFTGVTDFEGAQARESEVRNIKKGPGATMTAQGSNIKFY